MKQGLPDGSHCFIIQDILGRELIDIIDIIIFQ